MPYGRDPLSQRYDAAAGRLVGRALAEPGTWVYSNVARPRRASRVAAMLAGAGLTFDATDAGGLTAWERAYLRAVYHALGGGGGGHNETWSLQRQWGPRTMYGRLLGVRVSRKEIARRAVKRKPASERYTENPAIRSGGRGSGRERFG